MEPPIIIVEDDSQIEQIDKLFRLLNKKGTLREIKEIIDRLCGNVIKRIRLKNKLNGFDENLSEFMRALTKVSKLELKRIGGEASIQEEPDYTVKISDVQDVLVSILSSLVRTNTKKLEKPEYYGIVINNFKKMKNEFIVDNKVANKYWAFEKKAFRQVLNKYTKEKIQKGKKVQFKKLMYLNLTLSVLIGLANETFDVLEDHINKGNKEWEIFKKEHGIGKSSGRYDGLFELGS